VRLRLATGPVSWGVDVADAPGNPPWEDVLDEIALSGFTGTELGPVGYLPEEPVRLRAAIESRGLSVGGSFVFQPLSDPAARDAVLAVARRTCAAIAAAGGAHLVVIDLVSPERAATAGDPDAAVRLDEAGWAALVDGVAAVAELAAFDYGLRPVFHPHVGSHVEFADEIERLLDSVAIDLCIDTGHSAYAGVDPVALFERRAPRVPYLHLKDVEPTVLAGALAERIGFWAAIDRGVFCPLGQGMVDFPGLANALERAGFDGWATVEQDRVPGSGAPLADVVASRRYLEGAGLGDTLARA
jgi:inosose dehydratase